MGFGWMDYVMFGGMLLASLAIGIFYAYKDKDKANEEFLLGGRTMSCVPVSMSLVASYISAILVLGTLRGCTVLIIIVFSAVTFHWVYVQYLQVRYKILYVTASV